MSRHIFNWLFVLASAATLLGLGPAIGAQDRVSDNATSVGSSASPTTAPSDAISGQRIEAARVIAMVGDQAILAGDLLPLINRFIRKQIPPEQYAQLSEETLRMQRWQIMKQMIGGAIDTKLAYLRFLQKVPPDNLPRVLDELNRKYDDEQLPKHMQEAGVNSPAEYDRKLAEIGSSLEKERRMFAEQLLAQAIIGQNIDRDREVTHQQLLDYYRQHEDEYRYNRRARWEQLAVYFANYPNRTAAQRAIGRMGNEVLHGAPFAAVARRSSEGPTAQDGGRFDWTEQGEVVSAVIDQALFSLPVGELSEVLEDEKGYYIIRVLERVPAGMVPFQEVQQDIEDQIRQQRIAKQAQEYLEKVRAETPVWTIFEEDYLAQD